MQAEARRKKISGFNEFGTLSREALKELVHESENKHWKNALWETKNEVLIDKRSWFENKRKGYFYLMNASSGKGRALDIGAGSGIISDILSTYFREVITLEYNPDFINFMKLRFRQDKRDNIKIVRGNALELPFEDNSFEQIVVNGVLEWVPNFAMKEDPENIQIDFLKLCRRKIEPGGQIFIGIENRFHFRYLLGDTPHGDYPFTTVLPRPIANIITRMVSKKSYRNYIYSSFGYKRILKKAGFKNIRLFVIAPSYYNPMHILPFESNTIIKKIIMSSDSLPQNKMKRIIYSLLVKTGIFKYFMHSFYIVGEK